jgi:hypothetical protein
MAGRASHWSQVIIELVVIKPEAGHFMIKIRQCRQGWIEISPLVIGVAGGAPCGELYTAVHSGLTG